MKKFKFQLETLLKVTRRKKDDAEMKFAEVSRRLEQHRARLQVLLGELQAGQAEYAERTSAGKTINVDVIVTYNNFFNRKREQIERQLILFICQKFYEVDSCESTINKLVSIAGKQ